MDFDGQCMYECTVYPWGTATNRINLSEFPKGHDFCPPLNDKYINIRVSLNEHYWHVPTMHLSRAARTNTTRYDFLNVSIKSIEQAARCIISILNVPQENVNSIMVKILDYANNMVSNTHKDCVIFFMLVGIDVSFYYYDSYQATEAFMEDKKKYKLVKVQKNGSNCPICLEDIQVGTAAFNFPCSHLSHEVRCQVVPGNKYLPTMSL